MFRDVRLVWLLTSVGLLSAVAFSPFHLLLPYLWWRYVHIMTAAMYSGVVVISTLFEWRVAKSESRDLLILYHDLVTTMDKKLITLSVSGLLTSAIAMMAYQGLALWHMDRWPLWSSSALIIISFTGLIWGVFDLRTQKALQEVLKREGLEESDQSIQTSRKKQTLLNARQYINLFSVSTIPILYYLMIFKPQ